MSDQREVDARRDELARSVREMLSDGQSIDDALAFVKAQTAGMFQPILVMWKALDVELTDARLLVETSPTFNPDQFHLHVACRSDLLRRLGLGTAGISAADV